MQEKYPGALGKVETVTAAWSCEVTPDNRAGRQGAFVRPTEECR